MPRIELLGGVNVIGADASVPPEVFGGRRGRVVLAVLAMERGRTVDEDELAEALWPRALPPTWRPAVRSAISRVRDVLDAHRDHLATPTTFWVAYPKANRIDINRDTLWPILTGYGMRPIGQVAVDDVWSALRFRPLKEGEEPFTGGRSSS